MKIYIIEDDLIIAQNLKENLQELGYEIVGMAASYRQVRETMIAAEPDLCLVDIYLKGSAKNGIEIVREMQVDLPIPYIYLTSFSDHEYLDKAKGTNPAAYLLKPVDPRQIDVTIDLAMSTFYQNSFATSHAACPLLKGPDHIFVKTRGRYEKVVYTDILYLQSSGTYTEIVTSAKKVIISQTLKKILPQLASKSFVRCHRSYAVNSEKIAAYDESFVYLVASTQTYKVPVSRSYRDIIISLLPRIKV